MTIRQSTGLRNLLCGNDGFASALKNGEIRIYTGTQPATADAAVTGTLLGVVTKDGAARVAEVQASATLTLSGSAGSIDAVTVGGLGILQGGPVAFSTDLATTAQRLAVAITLSGICTATATGAVVTVRAPAGTGASWNGAVLAATTTTLAAAASGNLAGGVDASNGLRFSAPSGGMVAKVVDDVWRFNGLATGSAGWFRFVGNAEDAGLASTTHVRLDGSIGPTGDMVLASVAITAGAPNTVDAFSYTIPAV